MITTQPGIQQFNTESAVITTQPTATKITDIRHPKEFEINAVTRALTNRNLQFFKVTDNYMAYSQQVYYTDNLTLTNVLCCKLTADNFYSGNQLTIINYSDATVEKIQIKPSILSSKNILFKSNNNTIIALENSGNNSKLYLIHTKYYNQDLTSAKKVELNPPSKNICTAGVSVDGNIYIAAIGKDDLNLWSYNPTIEGNNSFARINWQKIIIDIPADTIEKVAFSENSRYLFVRLKTGVLNIYDYDSNSNWSIVAQITETTSFPVDIYDNKNSTDEDEPNKFIAFIEGQTVIVKNEKDNTLLQRSHHKNLTTACFVIGTKDLLVFDVEGIIDFAKYSDHYDYYKSERLPYKIQEIYSDPKDNTILIALAEQTNGKIIAIKVNSNKLCYSIPLCSLVGGIASCAIEKSFFSILCVGNMLAGCLLGYTCAIIEWDALLKTINNKNCLKVKKTVTLGDAVEQKSLTTIQQPTTSV